MDLCRRRFITPLPRRQELSSYYARPYSRRFRKRQLSSYPLHQSNPEDMSRFEVLEVNYNHNHSDSSSNCSIHQAALDPNDYRNKDPINTWGNYQSFSSGQRDEEIAHSAHHWSDCFVLMCPLHEDDKIMNKVYAGELKSSPPLDNLRQGAMQDTIAPEFDKKTILSP